MVQKVAEIMEY
jgi:hypothetical protein